MLIVGAATVFVHFDDAMDRIWNVPRRSSPGFFATVRGLLVDRFRAFVMLLGISLFILAGFIATMSLSAAKQFAESDLPFSGAAWTLVMVLAAVLLNWLLFMVTYKTVTKPRVHWSEAARGALFASIMWEIGRRLLAALVIGSRFSIYGVVGAFVAIMLWTFYAVTVLFLGAEYIQVFCARCKAESAANAGEP